MQKILVKRGNIFDMHEHLGKKILFNELDSKRQQHAITADSAQQNHYSKKDNEYVSAGAYDPYANYTNSADSTQQNQYSKKDNNKYVSADEYDPYAKYE